MKYRILFIIVLFFSCFLYSQKKLCFSYDNAGNQIKVSVCLNAPQTRKLLERTITEEMIYEDKNNETISENSEIDAIQEIILKAAPNPTEGQLIVYWHHYENKGLVRLFISSADMRILYDNTSIDSPMEQLELNVYSYVPGVYYLVGIFADGTKKTFRIIKK